MMRNIGVSREKFVKEIGEKGLTDDVHTKVNEVKSKTDELNFNTETDKEVLSETMRFGTDATTALKTETVNGLNTVEPLTITDDSVYDKLNDIKTKTDELPADTNQEFVDIKGSSWTNESLKTIHDKIPSNDADDYKADVSGLALELNTSKLLYKDIDFTSATGNFDIAVATDGDIYIEDVLIYSLTAATDLDSVSIVTDDNFPFVIMSSDEGAIGSLIEGKTLKTDGSETSFYLGDTKKIEGVISGTGSWSAKVVIKWRPIGAGGSLQ